MAVPFKWFELSAPQLSASICIHVLFKAHCLADRRQVNQLNLQKELTIYTIAHELEEKIEIEGLLTPRLELDHNELSEEENRVYPSKTNS